MEPGAAAAVAFSAAALYVVYAAVRFLQSDNSLCKRLAPGNAFAGKVVWLVGASQVSTKPSSCSEIPMRHLLPASKRHNLDMEGSVPFLPNLSASASCFFALPGLTGPWGSSCEVFFSAGRSRDPISQERVAAEAGRGGLRRR